MEIDAGTVRVDIAQTNSGTHFVGNGATIGTAASLLVGGGSAGLSGGVSFNRSITINPGNGTNRTVGGTNTTGTNTISSALNMSGSFGEDRSVILTAAAGGTVDISGAVTGAGQNITKSGSGTVVLSNTSGNTYTGATTVAAGKLAVNGSTSASSAVGVSSGGTLAGSGTVGGNATLASGGTLAPGNSPGVLKVAGTTTLSSGSIFAWEIDTSQSNPETNRGIAYDGLNTTSVSGSGAFFKIMLTGTQDFTDTFWNQTRTWTDIFKSADGGTNLSNWASVVSGGFQYSYNGQSVAPTSQGYFTTSGNSLTWSAVPEPSNAITGLIAATALLRRRRKN